MLAHAGAADEGLGIILLVGGLWAGWVGWSRLRGKGFRRLPRGGAVGLLVLGAGLVVASVTVPGLVFGPVSLTSGPRPALDATLAFDAPSNGDVVATDEVQVALNLTGGTVMERTGAITPDAGHLHVRVDGTLVSMTLGEVQVLDLRPFGSGTHTIEAEFVAADHLPFSPPVSATVTIEKEAPA